MFGYDMLASLPPGSVMIGGTDPGRFVPTYMIFGESPQSPRHKRAPNFDRRDLYIITQNALGEEFYMKYLRDHYGENRPHARNAFERWLERHAMYPEKPLKLPTDEQIEQAIAEAAKPDPETGKPSMELDHYREVMERIRQVGPNKEGARFDHDYYRERHMPLVQARLGEESAADNHVRVGDWITVDLGEDRKTEGQGGVPGRRCHDLSGQARPRCRPPRGRGHGGSCQADRRWAGPPPPPP